jgi:hypothetical protein
MARCGTWDGRTYCRWEVGGGEGEREGIKWDTVAMAWRCL